MSEIRFYGNLGEYGFLSNFYEAPFKLDGDTWPTVEHYFQAVKTFDETDRRRIRDATNPAKAKSMGRKVLLRKDWEGIKQDVMRKALRAKFSIPELREQLLATGDAKLIEAAPRDYYWGAGAKGTGKNRLGVLLAEIRDELKVTG